MYWNSAQPPLSLPTPPHGLYAIARGTSRMIRSKRSRLKEVVQVCLYNWFLSKQPNPTILDAVAHINHIVRLVGIDHVGIGTDFDGDDTEKLTGCRAANEVINLTIELLRQGYTAEELHKLWGDNLLRVLNTVQN